MNDAQHLQQVKRGLDLHEIRKLQEAAEKGAEPADFDEPEVDDGEE